MLYVTREDLKPFIPNLKSGTANEIVSNTTLDNILNVQANKIISFCGQRGYDISSPSPHAQYLLALLNLEEPASDLTLSRSPQVHEQMLGVAIDHQFIASKHIEMLQNGIFKASFNQVIPVTALCTIGIINSFIYPFQRGFSISSTSIPNDTFVNRWINLYSAMVYSILRLRGYKLSGFNSDQTGLLNRIVGFFVCANVLRIRALLERMNINDQVNQFLFLAESEIDKIVDKHYRFLLKS